jgi:N-acylneuraminate cytidylyltransferase
VDTFLKKRVLFGNNSGGIVISEFEGQDIDNITDWELAELKYKLLNKTLNVNCV